MGFNSGFKRLRTLFRYVILRRNLVKLIQSTHTCV